VTRGRRDEGEDEGTVMTEYVIVLALVSVGCVAALIGLGPPLLALFRFQRAWLALPFP
jgi:Flp pilus assembly pilin Flp